jgi:hypothetical protein
MPDHLKRTIAPRVAAGDDRGREQTLTPATPAMQASRLMPARDDSAERRRKSSTRMHCQAEAGVCARTLKNRAGRPQQRRGWVSRRSQPGNCRPQPSQARRDRRSASVALSCSRSIASTAPCSPSTSGRTSAPFVSMRQRACNASNMADGEVRRLLLKRLGPLSPDRVLVAREVPAGGLHVQSRASIESGEFGGQPILLVCDDRVGAYLTR